MLSSLRTADQGQSRMPTDLTFTSLICSRLCHDLVGPVGAIANGIELMEMEDDPAMADDALDLLRSSATNASRRLSFLRLAFGSSGGDELPLPVADARRAAVEFFEDHRLELVWPEGDAPGVAKGRTRLALNLLLAGAGGLIRGGDLLIDLTSDVLIVRGVHERAGLSEQVVDALEGRSSASTGEDARIIECYLAHMIAENEGLTIKVDQGAGQFTISVS